MLANHRSHIKNANEQHEPPEAVDPARDRDYIARVIAIDGSTVPTTVRNGYPGAEAALMPIAVVVLGLRAIKNADPKRIPSPSEIRDMQALYAALPDCNVAQRGYPSDSPKRYFRRTIYHTLQ